MEVFQSDQGDLRALDQWTRIPEIRPFRQEACEPKDIEVKVSQREGRRCVVAMKRRPLFFALRKNDVRRCWIA